MSDRQYSVHMTCSSEVKDMIMIECKKDFLRYHPEFKGMKMSQGFMLRKIAETYLKI